MHFKKAIRSIQMITEIVLCLAICSLWKEWWVIHF